MALGREHPGEAMLPAQSLYPALGFGIKREEDGYAEAFFKAPSQGDTLVPEHHIIFAIQQQGHEKILVIAERRVMVLAAEDLIGDGGDQLCGDTLGGRAITGKPSFSAEDRMGSGRLSIWRPILTARPEQPFLCSA